MQKINRDHRARLVSSNRENFRILTIRQYDTFSLCGDIRVPPRVPASGPEPCGGNNPKTWRTFEKVTQRMKAILLLRNTQQRQNVFVQDLVTLHTS